MASFVPSLCANVTSTAHTSNAKSTRRPRAAKLNLRDAHALDAELRRFSAKVYADETVLPRQSDLVRERRGDLRYAIVRYHGGFRAFSTVSSQRVPPRRTPKTTTPKDTTAKNEKKNDDNGDIEKATPDFRCLSSEVRKFIEEHIVPLDVAHADLSRRYFPTHAAFRLSGRSDLVRLVQAHGGSRAVALRMGLHLHYHAATDYAGEPKRFETELRRFIAPNARFDTTTAKMPTNAELHRAGRLDLIAGIRVHGGVAAVGSSLGLKLARGRRKSEVTKEREIPTILDESFFVIEVSDEEALQHNASNALRPKHEERGGAGGAILPREGGRRRAHYHYQDFDTVRRELNGFIFDDGTPGLMPTANELISAGRRDLVRAMQMHGGQKNVAAKLGLARKSMGRRQMVAAGPKAVSSTRAR